MSELAWKNRQILAERLHWPFGALDACEEIERVYHDWSPSWIPENTRPGFESPAGYWATRGGMHACSLFATTPEGLVGKILDAPPAEHNYGIEGCPVCAAAAERRIRRAGL